VYLTRRSRVLEEKGLYAPACILCRGKMGPKREEELREHAHLHLDKGAKAKKKQLSLKASTLNKKTLRRSRGEQKKRDWSSNTD